MKFFWLGLMLWSAGASSHPLAPALLLLQETTPQQYDVLWRTSIARVSGTDVKPVLPVHCTETEAPKSIIEEGEALALRWAVRCAQPLEGETLRVQGLERAGINVIVRVERPGAEVAEALLGARQTLYTVPPRSTPPPVFLSYLELGVEHLLTGWDHLLFVTGLLLLVRRLVPLVWTVTAFTAGHSVTLAAAALGWVSVPSAPVEIGIAVSILILACEILRRGAARPSLLMRYPWLMALGFGLLHGLGFAGVLSETGLPPDAIPLALLAFNLGIEAGQLMWVSVCLAVIALTRAAGPVMRRLRAEMVAAYVIGTSAAYWTLERAFNLLNG